MPRPTLPSLVTLALACDLVIACDRGPFAAGEAAAGDKQVVARIDGQPITLADLQRRMAEQPPYVQARYSSAERRKELLDNLIRFEILAREARRRGYEGDPQVLRERQQRLVDRMVSEELDHTLKPEDIPEQELRRFYQDHPERFTRPEAVRVSQILLADADSAGKVAAAARALGPRDDRGFRRLVVAHSLDEDSKQRGGDLTFLERQPAGTGQRDAHRPPAAVVEAAFALTEVGQIAGPIPSDRGFHVLRLTQRRPAALRPFEEVAAEVRTLVQVQRRSRRLDEWVAEMRNKVNIQIFEDKLQEHTMSTSSHRRLIFLAAGIALLASGAVAQARVVERVVAVVGDDIVLESEMNERARPFLQEVAALPDPEQRKQRAAAVRREVLDNIINEQLLLQQADELKLSVTSEEIDRSIEQIEKDYGLTDAQLLEELRKQGLNMASYRQSTRREILKYRVLNIAVGSKVQVSDNDVQNYYERNMKSGSNQQVRVSHIFVVIPENADASKVLEREQYAKKILARAKAGEEFAALAKELSEDGATRAEGGDLGYFGKEMGLPKTVEELVFSMKVGDVGGPVRGNQGFHVIKLVDRRAKDVKPLGDVKEELRGQLRSKEMERQTKAYLAELRRKTLVDIRLDPEKTAQN